VAGLPASGAEGVDDLVVADGGGDVDDYSEDNQADAGPDRVGGGVGSGVKSAGRCAGAGFRGGELAQEEAEARKVRSAAK
jgi:hypothetical protein